MNTSEILFNDIEAYLEGRMTEEQRTNFEKRIETDTQLQHEVVRHRKAALALQHGQRQSMKARLQSVEMELKGNQKEAPRRSMSVQRLAVAASILVLLAAGLHFYAHAQYRPSAVADRLFAETPQDQFRGNAEPSSVSSRFAQAEQHFRDREYVEASTVYLALIDEDNMLKDQAEWNLLLTYYASDPASKQFTDLFEKILTDTTHDYNADAVELRKTMEGTLYRVVNR